jgi:membrane fusion protein, multidrug efflux system
MTRLISACMLLAFFTLPTPAFAQRGPQGPIAVIVAPVQKAPFADSVEALGTTKSNETVVITPDKAEKVVAIHFEDGQQVKAGDLLVTLEKSEEEADLRSVEALLAERQSAYNRAKGLQDTNALSKATLQERQASLKQTQAEIESIEARISELAITAPFDGILGLREVSVGTLVQPGDTITTIDDLSQIKVDFDVPSVFLSTLKPGLPIVGKVEAFGDKEFLGEVRTVNTQVDPVTRTIKVRAVLPNPDTLLKPGLLMSIVLVKNQREALLIPEESLIKRGEKNFVYVADTANGATKAHQQEITIGGRKPGIIEVLSGLKEGDHVVSHGIIKISDGSDITIRAEEKDNESLDELLNQQKQEQPGKGG